MKKCRLLAVILLSLMCVNVTVSASEGETREEKMELYKALYGEGEPEGEIRPAISSQDNKGHEKQQKERESALSEKLLLCFKDEEKLYLPEAIKKIDEKEISEEDAELIRKILGEMMLCQGLYVQQNEEEKSDHVYTATVEIFLKSGIPTCIIDYTNYMGYLEEAEVIESGTDNEYTFETWPIGKMAGHGQEFFFEFNENSMHVIWGEGKVEYFLTKASGELSELEDKNSPFENSEIYQSMVKKIDEELDSLEHQVAYDEESRTFSIYLVIKENGRQKALENASQLKDKWNGILNTLTPFTEKLTTGLTLAVREGPYDVTKAHCALLIVDSLNSENDYLPQDIWAVIKDGSVEYDFYKDSSTGATPDTHEKKAESVEQGPRNDQKNNTSREVSDAASAGEINALRKADEYLDYTSFSRDGLVEQLEFEGFSHGEAVYGADHCGADWYEQAACKAREYLDYTSFSYEGLIEQLVFEGFTYDQAVYGANQSY